MNKKKAKQFKFTLLPPPGFIAEIAGINLQTFLSNFFKNSVSERTLRNTFKGKHKPSKATAEKILKVMPVLEQSRYMRFVLFEEELPSEEQNEWELQLESTRLGAGEYADEFFPYFQQKLKVLIEIEKSIYKNSHKATTIKEKIDAYKNIDFFNSLLSDEEKSILESSNCSNEEAEQVIILVLYKIVLYFASHLDAEFSYGYKDTINIRDGVSKLGKVSLNQAIFPFMEDYKYQGITKSKVIGSVEMLFRKWKRNFKTKYSKMEEFIEVSSHKDTTQEARKNKFRQWRKGEKVASHEEVLNIVKGLNPEIINSENWSLNVLVFYHISLFWENYFKLLKKTTVSGHKIFETDVKIVSWMDENYDKFFDEAYLEVERFYESV